MLSMAGRLLLEPQTCFSVSQKDPLRWGSIPASFHRGAPSHNPPPHNLHAPVFSLTAFLPLMSGLCSVLSPHPPGPVPKGRDCSCFIHPCGLSHHLGSWAQCMLNEDLLLWNLMTSSHLFTTQRLFMDGLIHIGPGTALLHNSHLPPGHPQALITFPTPDPPHSNLTGHPRGSGAPQGIAALAPAHTAPPLT